MSESSPRRWYAGVEGLRAVAALAVMAAHASIELQGHYLPPRLVVIVFAFGLQGLTLFFCLSGFLLYGPFVNAAMGGRSLPETRAFYRHRALRIYPAYVVILLVSGVLLPGVITRSAPYGHFVTDYVGRFDSVGTFLANVFLLQGYSPHTVMTGLNTSWSLLPEVVFYLLLPPMAWLAARLARSLPTVVAWLVPPVILVVVGLVCRHVWVTHVMSAPDQNWGVYLRDSGGSWSAVFGRSFLAQAELFGAGMVAAVLLARLRDADRTPVRRLRLVAGVAIGVGLLATAAIQTDRLIASWVSLVCAGLVVLVTAPRPGWLSRRLVSILESAPLSYLGRISYSIYLWHFPVILLLRHHVGGMVYHSLAGLLVSVGAVVVISVGLASLSFRFVEAPAMTWARTRDAVRREAVRV